MHGSSDTERLWITRNDLNRSLAMSYSHMGTPTLPSALLRFTSEFGMGSGGTTALLSLDKKGFVHGCTYVAKPWMAWSDGSPSTNKFGMLL